MKIVSAKCPNCGANIEVDENSNQTKCEFCSSNIIVEDAIEKYRIEVFGEVKIRGIKDERDNTDIVKKYIEVGEYENAFQLIQEVLKTNPFDEESLYLYFSIENIFITNKNEELLNCETVAERKKIDLLEFDDVLENRVEKIKKGDKLLNEYEKYKENVNLYNENLEKKKIRKILIKRLRGGTDTITCWIDDEEICQLRENGTFTYETLKETCNFKCKIKYAISFSNKPPKYPVYRINLIDGDRHIEVKEDLLGGIKVIVKKYNSKEGKYEIDKGNFKGNKHIQIENIINNNSENLNAKNEIKSEKKVINNNSYQNNKTTIDSEFEKKKAESNKKYLIQMFKYGISILKWVVSVFLLLSGVLLIFDVPNKEGKFGWFLYGATLFAFGFLLCPAISKTMQKYEKYAKNKKKIAIITFVIFIISIISYPANDSSVNNKDNTVNIVNSISQEIENNTTKDDSDTKKDTKSNNVKDNTSNTNKNTSNDKKNKETSKKQETIIIDGKNQGKYGKYDLFEDIPCLRYHIPKGKYIIKALTDKSELYIESKKLYKNSFGKDESELIKTIKLKKGETKKINIKSNQVIVLTVWTKIELKEI